MADKSFNLYWLVTHNNLSRFIFKSQCTSALLLYNAWECVQDLLQGGNIVL